MFEQCQTQYAIKIAHYESGSNTFCTLGTFQPKATLHVLLLNCIRSRGAKFACPPVLDDQKLSEDNQKLRFGCPPDDQIFFLENILKIVIHKNSLRFLFLPFPFPTNIYHFGNLKTNRILYGIQIRATKNMSRTARFPIFLFEFCYPG